ncbi:hypothetical protein [Flavobacterium sp. RSP15]
MARIIVYGCHADDEVLCRKSGAFMGYNAHAALSCLSLYGSE